MSDLSRSLKIAGIDVDPTATSTQIALERSIGRRSMRQFFEMSFPLLDPASSFVPTMAVDAFCDHLEACANLQMRRLCVALPPRNLKSTTLTAFAPWVWTWKPTWKFIFAAYAEKLVLRDSIRARRLVESEWYRTRFSGPDGWILREDQNTQDAFANNVGGHRLALSVGGRALGEGGDCIICDDPGTLQQFRSKAERERVLSWWFETMATRVNDAKTSVFIIVMQRLHPEDLIGAALARDLGYEYLMLPAECDDKRRSKTYIIQPGTKERTLFFEDKRAPGEFLCEAKAGREELDAQRKTLQSASYAAQYQQDPADIENAMMSPTCWRFWRPEGRDLDVGVKRPTGCRERADAPAVPLPRLFDRIIITVDCTLMGEQATDWTVIQVWASVGPDCYLLDQFRGKFDFPDVLEILQELKAANRYPSAKILIEAAMVGPALAALLRRSVGSVEEIKTQGKGALGKEGRVQAVLHLIEGGNVFLKEGADWLDVFVAEMTSFPGRHDDQVDCMSMALVHLGEKSARPGVLPIIAVRGVSMFGGARRSFGGGMAAFLGGPGRGPTQGRGVLPGSVSLMGGRRPSAINVERFSGLDVGDGKKKK